MQLLLLLGITAITILIAVTTFFYSDIYTLFSESSTAYQQITKGMQSSNNKRQ